MKPTKREEVAVSKIKFDQLFVLANGPKFAFSDNLDDLIDLSQWNLSRVHFYSAVCDHRGKTLTATLPMICFMKTPSIESALDKSHLRQGNARFCLKDLEVLFSFLDS